MDVLKIIPPLIIGEREIGRFVEGLDDVLEDCRRFPGPIWDLGANFLRDSLRGVKKASVQTVEAG